MLTKDDLKIGQWVNHNDAAGGTEHGRIKSWNDKWVFVVYHCEDEWDAFQQYVAAATAYKDLTIIEEPIDDV